MYNKPVQALRLLLQTWSASEFKLLMQWHEACCIALGLEMLSS